MSGVRARTICGRRRVEKHWGSLYPSSSSDRRERDRGEGFWWLGLAVGLELLLCVLSGFEGWLFAVDRMRRRRGRFSVSFFYCIWVGGLLSEVLGDIEDCRASPNVAYCK